MVAVTIGAARIAAASLAAKARPKRKGFFARLLDAVIEARLREARREMAMHRHLLAPKPLKRDEQSFGR